jgi:hypothetical protein
MTTIATKFQIGTAACAIAVASALGSAPIASADPAAPVPLASLGSFADDSGSAALLAPDCEVGSPDCDDSSAADLSASFTEDQAEALLIPLPPPPNPLQNSWLWFGPANPTPPPGTQNFFTFNPLPLIPGFLQPLWGWFTQNLNFQVCFLGFSVKVGPYGTVTGSVGPSC